ncbi:mannitol dehydrogenase family protein [Microbacterium invictum]|uniref:Fructuronate reductase n=1 Tax=Microbacterium invictum TaxID=515415 RepID=A0AA40VNF7_9MICO|nr:MULTISPECIES: mannitol dehydrogenase family protein [Microbacterium]MBB4140824.1 fructuronate reductase [Microbacterium invictum]
MSSAGIVTALARTRPRPPARIIHLGLGAFHRAHQAWYTSNAVDAPEWGIAAFAGRSAGIVSELEEQDCLYTLIQRSSETDEFEVIESVVEAHLGDDIESFLDIVRRPEVAVITLTVTEGGYRLGADGQLDLTDPVIRADIDALHAGDSSILSSAIARLVAGLRARHRAGAPALAVVSCDNLADNGRLLAAACLRLAQQLESETSWIDEVASFVSTSVDRITPRLTAADVSDVAERTGHLDQVPVVTEPFSDWVLEGEFPSGRPQWETAGARFVSDIRPWELRKLWLLNGAHTVLAALGGLKDIETVDEALRDRECANALDAWWREARRHLPGDLDLDNYLESLTSRFENPRIAHRLSQIAQDAFAKSRIRLVPVALLELRAGRLPSGALTGIAAVLLATGAGSSELEVRRALDELNPALGSDGVVGEVSAIIARLRTTSAA